MPDVPPADPGDHGLLSPPQTALLIDRYELAMAASYLRRGMNGPAVFELFARRLPSGRDWLMAAGLGPALALAQRMRFADEELRHLASLGFRDDFLEYLRTLRPSVDVDAVPEGTVVFANEPLLRVTGPRIEAQLLETLLLNQVDFQTAVATKAARVVLAAGGGEPGRGGGVVDFSPRRDHGVDAAMKAARAAVIAGAGGTSNVAAAMRYGLRSVGTMAHSYVMSFPSEQEAFRAFLEDAPENAILLVDTYDTETGVRRAIAAAREAGVALGGVRLDSGDLLELSRAARRLLDEAGLPRALVMASGDLDEWRILELVRAGAPVDGWGVGTALGTSADAPSAGCIYKLVADGPGRGGPWRPAAKRSPAKATVPYPKQVFRRCADGRFAGDVIGLAGERQEGRGLLVPAMRAGAVVLRESMDTMRERARRNLASLPPPLRLADGSRRPEPYPVAYSRALRRLASGAPG